MFGSDYQENYTAITFKMRLLRFSKNAASGLVNPSDNQETSRGIYLAVALVLTVNALVYLHRLTEFPGFLNAFGMQAIFNARHLAAGFLSLKDLTLLHEMTQEECGLSVAFVLWHLTHQTILSDQSLLLVGRFACASAAWISLILVFRVGRALLGPAFGLFALVSYSALPLSLYVARHEGIFGFSILLLLFFIDRALSFLARPRFVNALLLGIAIPLLGYGIANIRLLGAAVLAWLLLAILTSRRISAYVLPTIVTVVSATLLLIPQLLNWSVVMGSMKGRGEHLFGNYFRFWVQNDPLKRGYYDNAIEIISRNMKFISESIFGAEVRDPTFELGALAVPFVLGVCISLSRIFRRSYGLIFIVGLVSYSVLLIAVTATRARSNLLGLSQGFFIAVFCFELLKLLRWKLPNTAAWSIMVAVLGSLFWQNFLYARAFFDSPEGPAVFISQIDKSVHNAPVFIVDDQETIVNTARWMRYSARDIKERRGEIIGVRRAGFESTRQMIEKLDLPAVMVSQTKPPELMFADPKWRVENVPSRGGSFWWLMWRNSDFVSDQFISKSSDPYTTNTRVVNEYIRGSYGSPTLRERMVSKEGIDIELNLDQESRNSQLFFRNGEGLSAKVSVSLDGVALETTREDVVTTTQDVSWLSVGDLAEGTHKLSIKPIPDRGEQFISEIIVLGRLDR